ncbi:MAG: restriction endonuclease subunit S [Ignavibacteriaceae bacterium]|nr:restriction endonuclease subunit S [Ignavibacteriaceae bacterium]
MKQDWEIKKLSEVCDEIFAGGDVPKESFSKVKTDKYNIPIFSNGEKDKGLYGYSNISRVDKPCITISARGTIGYSEIRTGKFYPVVRLIVVIPKVDVVNLYFLKYAISSIEFSSSGTSIPQLTVPMVKEYEIPAPPLPEQKRIVDILDEAFAAIAKAKVNAEQNLNNAKELFESYLQNVFENKGEDWEEKTLGIICEIKPQKKEARDKLKGTELVTFLPMEDLGVLNKEIIGVKQRQLKDVNGSYTYFAENDVLLAKITPCFENGKIGIARNLINGVGFGSSEYIVFRSKGNILPDYLYYFLSRNQFRDEGKKLMSGAVGHKRVSKDWIENYIIPYPNSLDEQKTIIQKLEALSTETKKIETIYQKKIEDLEELKKSILQKAFNGELNSIKDIRI